MLSAALMCLALNVYHEARSEPVVGQYAVAHVTINRVQSNRWPNDVCKVVKQGYRKGRHRCQFSWYCDGLSDKPRNEKAFVKSQENAQIILNGWFGTFMDGATHYHADYVMPSWSKTHTRIVKIDSHIFYRWD